jgi:hypothetical protein
MTPEDVNGRVDKMARAFSELRAQVEAMQQAAKTTAPTTLLAQAQTVTTSLLELPAQLAAMRQDEAGLRSSVNEAKETVDFAIANALMAANGAIDGKNEEQRKVQRTAYLAQNKDVQESKRLLASTEAAAEGTEIHRRELEDRLSALKALANLIAAELQVSQ